jgi:hypothetical protein
MIKLNIIDDSVETPEHLGGHQGRSHIDVGTLEFIVNEYDIKSMVDVGQGPGAMVKLAKEEYDIDAIGVDGDPAVNADIHHDYTTGPLVLDRDVDLAWSVEFLEHVEETYLPNFMETFQRAKYILCTGAKPGEPGHHHVNCQPAHYWISKFAEYGFVFDLLTTSQIRNTYTTMNMDRPSKKQFVKNNGLFFVREDLVKL